MAICAEFFFIVSGVLLALTVEKNKYNNPINYIIHRYQRLWPQYIIYLPIYLTCIWISAGQIYREVSTLLLPILGLQILGIGDYAHNYGAVWYISVLIVCSYILFTLLKYCNKLFIFLIGPALTFFGYLYIFIENGSVFTGWDAARSVFSNLDFIRGFAGISLGIIIFYVAIFIKENLKYELKSNLFEVGLYIAAIALAITKKSSWICLFLMAGVVFVSLLGCHSNRFFSNRFVKGMEKISYSIYLNHALFVDFPNIFYIGITNRIARFIVFLLAVTIYSAIFSWIVSRLWENMKKLIVRKNKIQKM